MATTMHSGIGIDYLIGRIQELGDQQNIVAQDGTPLTAQAAIEYLQDLKAKGQEVVGSCPTPEPDGTCPGHPIGRL